MAFVSRDNFSPQPAPAPISSIMRVRVDAVMRKGCFQLSLTVRIDEIYRVVSARTFRPGIIYPSLNHFYVVSIFNRSAKHLSLRASFFQILLVFLPRGLRQNHSVQVGNCNYSFASKTSDQRASDFLSCSCTCFIG